MYTSRKKKGTGCELPVIRLLKIMTTGKAIKNRYRFGKPIDFRTTMRNMAQHITDTAAAHAAILKVSSRPLPPRLG